MKSDLELSVIQDKDIKSVDTGKLRDHMVHSLYALQTALMSQASFEHKRLGELREVTSELEKDLFSQESLNNMKPHAKMQAYQILTTNMQNTMKFMQSLHQNVESGVEVINQIEKMKTEASPDQNVVDKLKDIVKKKIDEKKSKVGNLQDVPKL